MNNNRHYQTIDHPEGTEDQECNSPKLRCTPRQRVHAISAIIYLAIAMAFCGVALTSEAQEQGASFPKEKLEQHSKRFIQARDLAVSNIQQGRQNQKKIDSLDDQRLNLADSYRNLLRDNRNLEQYNYQLQQSIQTQLANKSKIESEIEKIENLESQIVPHMMDMLAALEKFVALDLPFLLDERQARLRELKKMMSDIAVSNAEKYRRIMEAYQIENEYGRTIEAYKAPLERDLKAPQTQGSSAVTFLKIGRIALMYQDHHDNAYIWDSSAERWSRLEKSDAEHVNQGIQMALENIPSNLMIAPFVFSADKNNPRIARR